MSSVGLGLAECRELASLVMIKIIVEAVIQ